MDLFAFFSILLFSFVAKNDAHFQPNNLQQAYQQQQQHAPQYQPPPPPQYSPPQQQYQQPPQYQQQPPQPPQQYAPAAQPNQAPNVPLQNVAAAGHHHHELPADGNILHDQTRIHDKDHIKEHLGGMISEPDFSKMSEEELQFHYFKMHDNDNNNMLDGSELIKSLIHWHVEESKTLGSNAPPAGTTKIFSDSELAKMIDPILEVDDKNKDGFIDYPEFIAAQKSRGF